MSIWNRLKNLVTLTKWEGPDDDIVAEGHPFRTAPTNFNPDTGEIKEKNVNVMTTAKEMNVIAMIARQEKRNANAAKQEALKIEARGVYPFVVKNIRKEAAMGINEVLVDAFLNNMFSDERHKVDQLKRYLLELLVKAGFTITGATQRSRRI